MAAAAEILARGAGVAALYQLLEHVADRHRLSDAWLVLRHAGPVGGQSPTLGLGLQLFSLGGWEVPVETARSLILCPSGVYGEPDLDATTSSLLGAMCDAAFQASAAALRPAVDLRSGLQSRHVIGEAIGRAAACGARYGWSSTLVVLTTTGDRPSEERWLALSAALRQALRSGDEAGMTTPGTALAILGNAGPDAVRPFVARVRAALSAAGWEDVDLHAATARTPEETVDPAELRQLAVERLADAGVAAPTVEDTASTLELELRLLPGVTSVAMATPIAVLSSAPAESIDEDLRRAVRARLPHASVRVVTLSGGGPESTYPALETVLGTDDAERTNGSRTDRADEAGAPLAISATAPGTGPGAARGGGGDARVSLLGAEFDPERGTSEVSLALGAARGTGRASAGPLAGGAQATLHALEALALDVPYYLMSVERAHGVPGDPVVVVLAPKGRDEEVTVRAAERLGVATGDADVEAASRATLGALNRHLTKSAVAR
ncbi:MAG TPA: hypothetical protein VMD28_04070 [Acidimicrobiales bacterium]|nr:hypothetical protein [Acidimicrobiales bacterium]